MCISMYIYINVYVNMYTCVWGVYIYTYVYVNTCTYILGRNNTWTPPIACLSHKKAWLLQGSFSKETSETSKPINCYHPMAPAQREKLPSLWRHSVTHMTYEWDISSESHIFYMNKIYNSSHIYEWDISLELHMWRRRVTHMSYEVTYHSSHTYECDMSFGSHIWMRPMMRVTYMNLTCHSSHTYEGVESHACHMNETCHSSHTYEWDKWCESHIWMRHMIRVTHIYEICHSRHS